VNFKTVKKNEGCASRFEADVGMFLPYLKNKAERGKE
jgi:hypothetical protein